MKTRKNIKKIIAIGILALFSFGALAGCTTPKPTYGGVEIESTEQIEKIVAEVEANAKESVDITTDNEDAVNRALQGTYNKEQFDKAVTDAIAEQLEKDQLIIDDYGEQLKKQEAEDKATEAEESKFELEDVNIGVDIVEELTDRDITKLQDTEIEFDGDDYDVEEVFSLTGLNVAVNEKDYDGRPYLIVPTEGIVYKYNIDNALDTNRIYVGDESLTINFLGEELEIIEWGVDKITFNKGIEELFKDGETKIIDGVEITVRVIGNDFVSLIVDGETETIRGGETEEVGDIEIEAKEILYVSKVGYDSYVTLRVGEEVETSIEDGEEYEEDSAWEYVVDANSIGLKLVEEFKYIDEDEDFQALASGDTLSLPNDYITVEFGGLVEEDSVSYRFDTVKDNDYLRIRGEIFEGINDYTKVYIDNTGKIFDDDSVDSKYIGTSVELGNTGIVLNTNSTGVVIIDGIKMALNLSDITVETVGGYISLIGREDDYTTNYGITIENPEDAIEDENLKIVIPDEKAEAIVKIY